MSRAAVVVKTHRAGGDIEQLPEPDGRARHAALWDCF
jgi:hypothetical protein